METTTAKSPPTTSGPRRRWPGLLLGVVGAVLFIAASRFATGDLTIHSTVLQRSCQGTFCVERLHRPDLLLVPGRREIRVTYEIDGTTADRYYAEYDPFGDNSEVTIGWKDGGVSLDDHAATLSWDAQTLSGLAG